MPKRLNSFIISDELIKKMESKIEEARIKDVEVGFNLCAEDSILHDESHCIGTECEIELPEKCLKGKKAGIFHTHGESLQPSMADIVHAYRFGINCIGSIEEKKIRCHIRKDKVPKIKDLESIINDTIIFEGPLSSIVDLLDRRDRDKYIRWIHARNDLQDKYLHAVDID